MEKEEITKAQSLPESAVKTVPESAIQRISDKNTLYVRAYNATFGQILQAFEVSLAKYNKRTKQQISCKFIGRMWKTKSGLSRAYIYVTNVDICDLILNRQVIPDLKNIDWSEKDKKEISFPSPFFVPNKEQIKTLEKHKLHAPYFFKCQRATVMPLTKYQLNEECNFTAENIPSWITLDMVKQRFLFNMTRKKFFLIAGDNKNLQPTITLNDGKLNIKFAHFCQEINFIYFILSSIYFNHGDDKCIIQLKPN